MRRRRRCVDCLLTAALAKRRDREELAAAVVQRYRIDNLEGAAIAQDSGSSRCERRGFESAEALHAALHFAAVVGTGDDFLPGVAALVEGNAVDEIEVEHLRDERFAR